MLPPLPRIPLCLAVLRIVAALAAFTAMPAFADMGPCKPHGARDILLCGEGDGAAIVIADTTSPSKTLALAWRSPDASPLEQPDDDAVELLILRLKDGAVLARSKTEYWNTGELRANHPSETAWWSPDSRFLVRSFSMRYGSDTLELYEIGSGSASRPFDLLGLLDAPLRKSLKPRLAGQSRSKNRNKDVEDFIFILAGRDDRTPAVQIDARGNIRMNILFWAPKAGPFFYYTVHLTLARGKDSPTARIASIAYRGMSTGDGEAATTRGSKRKRVEAAE